eukprot:903722-Rhodomonas_salina.1
MSSSRMSSMHFMIVSNASRLPKREEEEEQQQRRRQHQKPTPTLQLALSAEHAATRSCLCRRRRARRPRPRTTRRRSQTRPRASSSEPFRRRARPPGPAGSLRSVYLRCVGEAAGLSRQLTASDELQRLEHLGHQPRNRRLACALAAPTALSSPTLLAQVPRIEAANAPGSPRTPCAATRRPRPAAPSPDPAPLDVRAREQVRKASGGADLAFLRDGKLGPQAAHQILHALDPHHPVQLLQHTVDAVLPSPSPDAPFLVALRLVRLEVLFRQ